MCSPLHPTAATAAGRLLDMHIVRGFVVVNDLECLQCRPVIDGAAE